MAQCQPKLNANLLRHPTRFFYHNLAFKQAIKQAQRVSTSIQNPASNQAQEASTLNIKPGIQIATEDQQLHYRIQHVNDSETRRKAWYLDYIVVVRLNGGWQLDYMVVKNTDSKKDLKGQLEYKKDTRYAKINRLYDDNQIILFRLYGDNQIILFRLYGGIQIIWWYPDYMVIFRSYGGIQIIW